jgi:hypothetical protein
VLEYSDVVRDIVAPTLDAVLAVPLDVQMGDITAYLAGPVTSEYDTIFLDTWETIDAAHLPAINRLRDDALRHLAPGGRVLLWGYRWMLRLFEAACRQLLALPPAQRGDALDAQGPSSPAAALLAPVLERFDGDPVPNMAAALAWCHVYAVNVT